MSYEFMHMVDFLEELINQGHTGSYPSAQLCFAYEGCWPVSEPIQIPYTKARLAKVPG